MYMLCYMACLPYTCLGDFYGFLSLPVPLTFIFPSPHFLPYLLPPFLGSDLWLLLQRLQGSSQITDYGLVACNPNPINSHSCSLAHTQR